MSELPEVGTPEFYQLCRPIGNVKTPTVKFINVGMFICRRCWKEWPVGKKVTCPHCGQKHRITEASRRWIEQPQHNTKRE